MAAAPFYTICRRTYRGGFAAHAATKSHRAAAARAATRRLGTADRGKTRSGDRVLKSDLGG